MEVFITTIVHIWHLTALMAPSLLAGFAVAGVLSLLVTKQMVYNHLGRSSFWQICKASLFGVPLPLCSCSVLPVAVSLRDYGAGKGSVISFLTSTPQTGVDSIFVTYTMLGPVYAVVRCVAAFFSGIICGSFVQLLGGKEDDIQPEPVQGECCCSDENKPSSDKANVSHKLGLLINALRYAFLTLPRDLGRSMILGLILSGILTAFLPANYFADKLIGNELISMLVMLVIGLIVYVCSTGSVPIVVSLIAAGISPGAGLVFLIAGPATNITTIVTLLKIIGVRITVIYLLTLSITAIISGYLLNMFIDSAHVAEIVHGSHDELSLLSKLGGVVLVLLFVPAFLPKKDK